jgi:Na+/H+ antiporter NhaC
VLRVTCKKPTADIAAGRNTTRRMPALACVTTSATSDATATMALTIAMLRRRRRPAGEKLGRHTAPSTTSITHLSFQAFMPRDAA